MASRGNNLGNSHLQVGSRLTQARKRFEFGKLIALLLTGALVLSSFSANAATKKPTPKPTSKVSAKATAKATAKPKAKATKKATSKSTAKATKKSSAKPTAKATAKASAKASPKTTAKASAKPKVTKKPVVKKKKKAKVRITPSPKPAWPPKGFSVEGEVYAKVPTAKELIGLISANATLQKRIKECSTFICGSVQVASETGCIWWEVIATVSDAQGAKLGDLTSAFGKSEARELKTLIVISPESLDKGGSSKIVSVICHHEDRITGDPTTVYKKS
jgi:chemotaxis protein histidine kinase CheA